MNFADTLFRIAKALPDRPALSVDQTQTHTFGRLAERSAALARSLTEDLGLAKGDRVGVAMSNAPEFFEVAFASWCAGLVLVPTNPRLHPAEFAYIFKDCEARVVFATPDLAPDLAGLPDDIASVARVIETGSATYEALAEGQGMTMTDVAPEDLGWIFYTSGTTGRPKGAMLSHRNLAFMASGYYADIDRVEPGHVMLHAAALSHGAGLYAMPHLAQGGHQVICDGSFDPALICRMLDTYDEVSFFAAPTMLTRFVNHVEETGADTSSLRTIVYGGGPAYVSDLEKALDVLGLCLAQLYGQGEAPMTISILPKSWHPMARREGLLGSCGVARTNVEMRIVDAYGQPVAPGETGEITTRSDCVMAGYLNLPEATAEALRGGWLHTGDLGSVDERGFLTLKDRSKDMIITGGSNVYPREVEELLLQHRNVAEVAVVSRPHADWIEEVVACVVTKDGQKIAADLDELCLGHMARYKRPRSYVFMDALPKNNYGKVLKTDLRAALKSGDLS